MPAMILTSLVFAAALGSGLLAGLFFIFSNTIMSALARLPAAQGMAAMQSINVTILNPLFLTVFMGTSLLCLVLVAAVLLGWAGPNWGFVAAGGLLLLVGMFGVTMFFNVPMNEALVASTADSAGTALWADYLSRWTMWNHVRTIASLGALAAFMAALMR